jgi:hypothetical protein
MLMLRDSHVLRLYIISPCPFDFILFDFSIEKSTVAVEILSGIVEQKVDLVRTFYMSRDASPAVRTTKDLRTVDTTRSAPLTWLKTINDNRCDTSSPTVRSLPNQLSAACLSLSKRLQ